MKRKDGDGESSTEDRADGDDEGRGGRGGDDGRRRERDDEGRGRWQPQGGAAQGDEDGGFPEEDLIERATERLSRLTGKRAESVSAVVPSDNGWRMTVEIVELERIPETTSVLGTYEAEIDEDGHLVSYERTRRYLRNQADG